MEQIEFLTLPFQFGSLLFQLAEHAVGSRQILEFHGQSEALPRSIHATMDRSIRTSRTSTSGATEPRLPGTSLTNPYGLIVFNVRDRLLALRPVKVRDFIGPEADFVGDTIPDEAMAGKIRVSMIAHFRTTRNPFRYQGCVKNLLKSKRWWAL